MIRFILGLAFALALHASAGCGSSAPKMHAEGLRIAHETLSISGRLIEQGCTLGVQRAADIPRAEQVATRCRTARDAQHALVDRWMLWARTALASIEGKRFDLGVAVVFTRELVQSYASLRALLEGVDVVIPELPPLLLQLSGL